MKTVTVAALIVVWLAACASAQPMFVPDGRQGYMLDCSTGYLTWGDCMQKASQMCGSAGYDIFTSSGDAIPMGDAGYTPVRQMTIACGHKGKG